MALDRGPKNIIKTGAQAGSDRLQEAAEKRAKAEVQQKLEKHQEKIELNTTLRDSNRPKNRVTGRPAKTGKELSAQQRSARQHRREHKAHDRRAHQRIDQEIARRQTATRNAQNQVIRNRGNARTNATNLENENELTQNDQNLNAQNRLNQNVETGHLENKDGGLQVSNNSLANGNLDSNNKVVGSDVFQQKLQERNLQQDQATQNATDINPGTATELDPALANLESVDTGLEELRNLLIELFLRDKKIRKKANLIATLGAILTMAAIRIQDLLEERGLNDLTDDEMEDLEDFMQSQREAALREAEEADIQEEMDNKLDDTDEDNQKKKAKRVAL